MTRNSACTTTKLLIYRNGRASASAFALRNALLAAGIDTTVNKQSSDPRTRRQVINWGVTNCSLPIALNQPENVAQAVDKLTSLEILEEAGVRVPPFKNNEMGDNEPNDDGIWLARTCTNCRSGRGIVVVREGEIHPRAPLYVKYIKKGAEYRVHVFKDEVIFVQQKRKKSNVTQTEDQSLIRSHANGWVFAENNITFKNQEQESCLKAMCVRAVSVLGLDFGAVDVIVGKNDGLPYILEVNTAPGLQSTRLISAYVDAIKRWAG